MVREIVRGMSDDKAILCRQFGELSFQTLRVQECGKEKRLAVVHDADLVLVRHGREHDIATIRSVRRTLKEIAVCGRLDGTEEICVHGALLERPYCIKSLSNLVNRLVNYPPELTFSAQFDIFSGFRRRTHG